jgi:hypothetical protein
MASFNYTVDTQPMADELSSVSRHVNVTTGAVVAMQTAVIAAEEKAADHVCNNVNKGFYSLIRSQISQKLAKLQSEVDSHIMQLTQQKKALLGIKNRMQRDYNMIAKRYTKLFNGLNANLKNRIFELDKPTIDFACKEIDKVSNRTKYLTATVPIAQLESVSLSQKIIASNVKQRGLNVINSMRWFIYEMNVQKRLTDRILIEEKNNIRIGTSFIPVAFYECCRDRTDRKNVEVIVSDVELSNNVVGSIRNVVYDEFPKLEWSQESPSKDLIKNEFANFITSSSKSTRIKELTLKLFERNNYLCIK